MLLNNEKIITNASGITGLLSFSVAKFIKTVEKCHVHFTTIKILHYLSSVNHPSPKGNGLATPL